MDILGIVQDTTVQIMVIRKKSHVDKMLQNILAFYNIQPFVLRTSNLVKPDLIYLHYYVFFRQ